MTEQSIDDLKTILDQTKEDNKQVLYPSEPLIPPGWLPQLLLSFYGRVVRRGNKEPYKVDMLFNLQDDLTLNHCQEVVCQRLKAAFKVKPLDTTTLIKTTLRRYVLYAICQTLANIVHLILPLLLMSFIEWVQEEPQKKEGWADREGYILVGLLYFSLLAEMVTQSRALQYAYEGVAFLKNTLSVRFVSK